MKEVSISRVIQKVRYKEAVKYRLWRQDAHAEHNEVTEEQWHVGGSLPALQKEVFKANRKQSTV